MKHTKNNHRIMKNNKFGLFRINSRRKEGIKKKSFNNIKRQQLQKQHCAYFDVEKK